MIEFKAQNYDTAKDFLDSLRLSNADWWPFHSVVSEADRNWQRDWIFRGESSTKKWIPLVPTAWRNPETPAVSGAKSTLIRRFEFQNVLRSVVETKQFLRPFQPLAQKEQLERRRYMKLTLLQAFAEITLINEFTTLADELGFRVSTLPDWTRQYTFVSRYAEQYLSGLQIQVNGESTQPHVGEPLLEPDIIWINPAVALAQHHGMPTRLLDWTRNPLAAAYFAAAGVDNPDNDDHIAVYAIHREYLTHHIRMVRAPSSDNDYLRAQRGVFTLDNKGDENYLLSGSYLSLEESIKQLPAVFNPVLNPRKLVLRSVYAPDLIRLLWLEGITKAHLMPTLDNVANAIAMKLRLSRTLDTERYG